MTNKSILDALNAAGEALKATGEQSVVLTYFQMVDGSGDRFAIRLDMPGTSGAHGSGITPGEAFGNAMAQRERDMERAEIEAQIRAEVEDRMAALGRQRAA